MTKATVTRKMAVAVLTDIKETYSDYLAGASTGPTLRDNDHEELPEGCWSIDWEEGPEGWVFEFSSVSPRYSDVLLEPINHVILGVYPA